MRAILIVLTGLGSGLLVGGVLAFAFGAWIVEGSLMVGGLGPFNGSWSRHEYCFLGAVMAAAGAGLTVSGGLGLGVLGRSRTGTGA